MIEIKGDVLQVFCYSILVEEPSMVKVVTLVNKGPITQNNPSIMTDVSQC